MQKKDIVVNYKGKRYESKPSEMFDSFDLYGGTESFSPVDIPAKLQRYFYFIEDEETLRLKSSYLVFDLDGDEADEVRNPIFNEVEEGEVIVYKDTLEVEEGFDFCEKFEIHNIDKGTYKDIVMFIEGVLKLKNEWVYDFVKDMHKHFKNNYYMKNILLANVFDVAVRSTEGFEKIAKVNPRFIYENILKDDFKLNNEGKLNKVVELPKFAIKYMKKNKLENCLGVFQEVNETDGNNLRILLDFFENMKVFVKSKDRPKTYYNFTRHLNEVISKHKYRLKDLLGYLVKQSFYFSKEDLFHFPSSEIILLNDYLDMCKKHDLKYERYPFLEREHNIAMKNIRVLDNPARNDDFVNSVKKYAHLVSENDDYIIKVPESIKDMVVEGNYLHHCVADYVSKVIDGESKIFFLRKKDEPDVPFVTIELDCDDLLVHTKGMFNEDPTGEDMKYINRWVGTLARRTKKSA